MAYRLSNSAEVDLINIYLDGVTQFGVAQAEAYAADLAKTFDVLAAFPGVAALRPEYSPAIRVFPKGVHVIVYTVDDLGDVLIVRIRHGREDWATDPFR